jgi:cytochrome oxidase Cu insertion factor (SCO1/SenC/PrrC family)
MRCACVTSPEERRTVGRREMTMRQRRQTPGWTALVAVSCWVTMLASWVVLAGAADRTVPVGVGAMAPDFTLEDQDRRPVTLSQARGQGPVVLVFYRGAW